MHFAIKKVVAAIIVCLLLIFSTTTGPDLVHLYAAGNTINASDISMVIGSSGRIEDITVSGHSVLNRNNASNSGFFVSDGGSGVPTDYHHADSIISFNGSKYAQNGGVKNTNVNLLANYETFGNKAIRISGHISNQSSTDRNVKLQYRIPVGNADYFWYDDINTKRALTSEGQYGNFSIMTDGHSVSVYPIGTISDGSSSVSIGIPMDPPSVFRISYENVSDKKYMAITFDFTLTDKTTKNQQNADFDFVLFTSDASWGMRSAASKYYEIYPDQFSRRVTEAGNWLFQQDYSNVYGLYDFGFKFNETPTYHVDKAADVISFRYIAPAEKWLGGGLLEGYDVNTAPSYAQYMAALDDYIQMPDSVKDYDFRIGTMSDSGKAVKSSAIYTSNNDYFTAGWGAYGPMVAFIMNGDPDIVSSSGKNFYELCVSVLEHAKSEASKAGYTLGGFYIDNLVWGASIYNYRQEHFQFYDYNMIWDVSNKNKAAIPLMFNQYELAKKIQQKAITENKIVLANISNPRKGGVHYAHLVDVPSGEIGSGWGDTIPDHALRRTLAYQKPWTLLLTQFTPQGVKVLTYDQRDALARRAMTYGVFANIIGLQPKITDYETYRPIFRKYTPSVKILDAAGWEPVTHAKTNSENIVVERFGSLTKKNLALTVYNTGSSSTKASIDIDLGALGCTEDQFSDLVAFDMMDNEYKEIVKISETISAVSVIASLNSGQAANILIGKRSDVFDLLKGHIDTEISRAKTAYSDIAAKIGSLPSGWFDLTGKITLAYSACGDKSLDRYSEEVLPKLANANSSAQSLREKIVGTYKSYYDADIFYALQDGYDMLAGLSETKEFPGNSSSQQSSINSSSISSVSNIDASSEKSSDSGNFISSAISLESGNENSSNAEPPKPFLSLTDKIGIDSVNNIIYLSETMTASEFYRSISVSDGFVVKVYDETFDELPDDSQITDSCTVRVFRGETEIANYIFINSEIPEDLVSKDGDLDGGRNNTIAIIIIIAFTLLILELMLIYYLKIRKSKSNQSDDIRDEQ